MTLWLYAGGNTRCPACNSVNVVFAAPRGTKWFESYTAVLTCADCGEQHMPARKFCPAPIERNDTMMIRRCDICGRKLERCCVKQRVGTWTDIDGALVGVNIIAGIGRTWNVGDLCAKCLLQAVLQILTPLADAVKDDNGDT